MVGYTYLEKVNAYCGNSVRIGYGKNGLMEAQRLGLKVLVNLPANAERYGFDYNDTAAVNKQTREIIEIVKNTKDFPAVMMWAIGNELDYIPGTLPFNLKVWDAVNQAAKAIKAILWKNVKEQHPDMRSSLDVAVEMEKLITKETLKDIGPKQIKDMMDTLKKHYEEKQQKQHTMNDAPATSSESLPQETALLTISNFD